MYDVSRQSDSVAQLEARQSLLSKQQFTRDQLKHNYFFDMIVIHFRSLALIWMARIIESWKRSRFKLSINYADRSDGDKLPCFVNKSSFLRSNECLHLTFKPFAFKPKQHNYHTTFLSTEVLQCAAFPAVNRVASVKSVKRRRTVVHSVMPQERRRLLWSSLPFAALHRSRRPSTERTHTVHH